jgi:hypothetical protein
LINPISIKRVGLPAMTGNRASGGRAGHGQELARKRAGGGLRVAGRRARSGPSPPPPARPRPRCAGGHGKVLERATQPDAVAGRGLGLPQWGPKITTLGAHSTVTESPSVGGPAPAPEPARGPHRDGPGAGALPVTVPPPQWSRSESQPPGRAKRARAGHSDPDPGPTEPDGHQQAMAPARTRPMAGAIRVDDRSCTSTLECGRNLPHGSLPGGWTGGAVRKSRRTR